MSSGSACRRGSREPAAHRRDRRSAVAAAAVVAAVLLLPSAAVQAVYVNLTSDSPAMLGATIQFNAEIIGDPSLSGPFVFKWIDTASPGHFSETTQAARNMTLQLSFDRGVYEARDYEMRLNVYEVEIGIFHKWLAEAKIPFRITSSINGNLSVSQFGVETSLVGSLNETNLHFQLYDPHAFLSGISFTYYWMINDTNFGSSTLPWLNNTFDALGHAHIEVLVFGNATAGANATSGLPATLPPLRRDQRGRIDVEQASAALGYVPTSDKSPLLFGIFYAELTSRQPITKLVVDGDRWFPHGKLLKLNVTCDGSMPITFCWKVVAANYTISGKEDCMEGDASIVCDFKIIWYFRKDGTSNVLIVAYNGVSKNVSMVYVNIYKVDTKISYSFIIVPIISVLFACVAFLMGVFMYWSFKRNLAIETADFDFSTPADELEHLQYMTFWERLREAIVNAFYKPNDDMSNVSTVSSRSVQPIAGGIHYGSIT